MSDKSYGQTSLPLGERPKKTAPPIAYSVVHSIMEDTYVAHLLDAGMNEVHETEPHATSLDACMEAFEWADKEHGVNPLTLANLGGAP